MVQRRLEAILKYSIDIFSFNISIYLKNKVSLSTYFDIATLDMDILLTVPPHFQYQN